MSTMAAKSDPTVYFNELELKQVDAKSKSTVFAYIRNEQGILSNEKFNIIPRKYISYNISILCLFF